MNFNNSARLHVCAYPSMYVSIHGTFCLVAVSAYRMAIRTESRDLVILTSHDDTERKHQCNLFEKRQ